ncbi:hypothetical protein GCM10009121_06650 [Rhodanobacter soli]
MPLADVPAGQPVTVDAAGQWKLHAATVRPCVDEREYKRGGMVAGEPEAKNNPAPEGLPSIAQPFHILPSASNLSPPSIRPGPAPIRSS